MFDVDLLMRCNHVYLHSDQAIFCSAESTLVIVSGQMRDCSRSESCACVHESWQFKRARCQWLGMPGVLVIISLSAM